MSRVESIIEQAIQLHRAGDLRRAELLYLSAIEKQPTNVSALYMLGCLFVHKGRPADAVEPLKRASTNDPDFSDARIVLGNAYMSLEQWELAVPCLARAAELEPEFVNAWINLGVCYSRLGRFEEAETQLRRALDLDPNIVEAVSSLAHVLMSRGRLDEAEAFACGALDVSPEYSHALNTLAGIHLRRNLPIEAESFCRRAIAAAPEMAEGRVSLVNILLATNRPDEALESARTALAVRPRSVGLHLLTAACLKELDRYEEVAEVLERAGEICTLDENPIVDGEKALAYRKLRRFDESIEASRACLAATDKAPELHVNLAQVLLALGRYDEGFAEYEWREVLPTNGRPTERPKWDGKPIPGKTLLVYAEQGMGDTVQFVRFLPQIKERSQANVLFEAPSALTKLLSGCPGFDEMIDYRAPDERYDFRFSLMSSGAMFVTDEASIPAAIPYVHVPDEAKDRWRKRIGPSERLRVGLCWSGNPLYASNRQRSLPLSVLLPLARVPGVELFSLQRHGGSDLASLDPDEMVVRDLTAEEEGLHDTAALMSVLDLVISIDSAITHVAGAVGVETFMFVPWVPDWRYLVDREDNPWYPSVRLFWQTRRNEWSDVVDRVAAALAEKASAKRR